MYVTPLIDTDSVYRDLDKQRVSNMNIHEQRKLEIYEKIPRIREIDKSMSSEALSVAKQRILDAEEPDKPKQSIAEVRAALREKNAHLSEEKRRLLKENGYPEDYLDDIFTCKICQDTGYYAPNAAEPHKKIQCRCIQQRKVDLFYNEAGTRELFTNQNFETFSFKYYSKEYNESLDMSPYEYMIKVFSILKDYAYNFDDHTENICLYGSTGGGKTFLSNCIAKVVFESGHTLLFLSENELIQNIISPMTFREVDEDQLADLRKKYDLLFTADLLIIDDFGTKSANSFVLEQLFEIINKRMLTKKPIILSTNHSIQHLKEFYHERIMSRLMESYDFYNIISEDIRHIRRIERLKQAHEDD